MPALSGEERVRNLPQLWVPNAEARGQDSQREGFLLCSVPCWRLLRQLFETDLQRNSGQIARDTHGGINGEHGMGNTARRVDPSYSPSRHTDLLRCELAAASPK